MEERDLQIVLDWRNSPRVRECMYNDHIISMDEHKLWFAGIKNENPSLVLIFEHKDKPLGLISIKNLDLNNGKCHWGFYIGDSNAPRGSGTAMALLAFEYIFETLKIRKLIGEVFSFNKASVKYHEKLGFEREARLVKHVSKDGQYEDVLSYALFRDKWLETKHILEKELY